MLKYNSYKIFQDKIGNQYLYLIDDNAIFYLMKIKENVKFGRSKIQ